jgi:predicted Zn-dependent protease
MPVDPRIRELCSGALDRARRHPEVTHAEVRWVSERAERLRVRDGAPDGIGRTYSAGFAVRLIARGAWGFACSASTSEAALAKMIDGAIATAPRSRAPGTRFLVTARSVAETPLESTHRKAVERSSHTWQRLKRARRGGMPVQRRSVDELDQIEKLLPPMGHRRRATFRVWRSRCWRSPSP